MVLASGAAWAVGGCAGGPGAGPAPRQAEAALPTVPDAGWDAWVAGFRPRALSAGISSATYERAFRAAGFTPGVIERDRNQTEFTRSLEDYLALLVSEEQVTRGREMLARQGPALEAIARRFGVAPEVVTAIWGVESRYGARLGAIPVISATSTLAYDGRRGAFFTGQVLAALRILERGDIGPERMTGSWAGAMGHTQFIPTSYLAHAVDFTGDGRADIWGADPTDALASTAAYLAESGWQSGGLWGMEVVAPAGVAGGPRAVAAWQALGVRAAAGGAIPAQGTAALIRPAGAAGPAFLTWRNFTAISRYNNAQTYVIAVGHLSDRLRGGPAIQGSFPPDAQGLTLAKRAELQRRLTGAGYDTQGTDGVIGRNTQAAIRAWQADRGLPVTGVATAQMLEMLR
jgi:lytic murein transglycosylase